MSKKKKEKKENFVMHSWASVIREPAPKQYTNILCYILANLKVTTLF